MSINNIKSSTDYLNNSTITNWEVNKNNIQKYRNTISSNTLAQKDTIDISKTARRLPYTNGIGLSVDKGTAAHTTLYVDRGTFEKISSYTTNNPECQWSEIGIDGEKRWVVVNGQRFECPLSKEEKEARRKYMEESNLISILAKREKELDKNRQKTDKKHSVKLTFNKNGKASMDGIASFQSNPKISGLMKNEKVMKMLSNISALNGGSINLAL